MAELATLPLAGATSLTQAGTGTVASGALPPMLFEAVLATQLDGLSPLNLPPATPPPPDTPALPLESAALPDDELDAEEIALEPAMPLPLPTLDTLVHVAPDLLATPTPILLPAIPVLPQATPAPSEDASNAMPRVAGTASYSGAFLAATKETAAPEVPARAAISQTESGQDLPAYFQDAAPADALEAEIVSAAAAPIPNRIAPDNSLDPVSARSMNHYEQAIRPSEPRTQLAVEAPLRSAAFANELSEKVVWMANRHSQTAEITLNPPQLGAVEVHISLSGGDAGAQFFSPQAAVREALEAALPRLKEMLAQAGISLGDAQVRDEPFAQKNSGGSNAGRGSSSSDEPPAPTGAHPIQTRAGSGLIDLYA